MTVKPSRMAMFVAGALTVIAGSAAAQYLPQQFADIPPGSTFADAVGKWWRRGVIKGYDDGRFGPDDPVTRGQLMMILDRLEASTIDPLRQEIMQINRVIERATPSPLVSPDTITKCHGEPCRTIKLVPSFDRAQDDTEESKLPSTSSDTFCTETRDNLDHLFDKYRSCQTDGDCVLFTRACGPYVTCGKAVTKNVLPTLERSVKLFEDSCTNAFPVACATCMAPTVTCDQGQCVAVSEELSPSEQCTAYLREGEEETYCARCGNGICEPFERCTSSNCQNGVCTQDCGGLYCPGDCL